MDITEARRALARITPPPLFSITLEEADNPARAAAEALINIGRKLRPDTEPPAELYEAAAKLGPEKIARLTIVHSQVMWNEQGEAVAAEDRSITGVNLHHLDADQFVDAVAMLLLHMTETHLRNNYKVDGEVFYRTDTEQGQMRWEAFAVHAQNNPLPAACDGACGIDHGQEG